MAFTLPSVASGRRWPTRAVSPEIAQPALGRGSGRLFRRGHHSQHEPGLEANLVEVAAMLDATGAGSRHAAAAWAFKTIVASRAKDSNTGGCVSQLRIGHPWACSPGHAAAARKTQNLVPWPTTPIGTSNNATARLLAAEQIRQPLRQLQLNEEKPGRDRGPNGAIPAHSLPRLTSLPSLKPLEPPGLSPLMATSKASGISFGRNCWITTCHDCSGLRLRPGGQG